MKLSIDNIEVEVPDGSSLLDAAAKAGIGLPTLCFLPGSGHFTSCMVCVVRDNATGRLVPACSAPAAAGVDIDTSSEEVRAARRDALDLLLSEHVGDCEGPCRIGCPAGMNIPLMLNYVANGRPDRAIAVVREHIPLPAVLGRICPAPCEKTCRRREHDGAVSICMLERWVADTDLSASKAWRPEVAPSSGQAIAIVGSGPAGLSAAYYLLVQGHACTIFDESEAAGGALRSHVPAERLPLAVLDAEVGMIRELGAVFRMNMRVGGDAALSDLRREFRAVVLATGEVRPDTADTLGVAVTSHGIDVEHGTMRTGLENVFVCGSAAGKSRMAVRAVASGRAVARVVDEFVRGGTVAPETRQFYSRIGRLLDADEMREFLDDVSAAGRTRPSAGAASGFSREEAVAEAQRCLHCECLKAKACALRDLGREYCERKSHGVPDRARVVRDRHHATVVWEQGKCIKCGICVGITESMGEPLGLTFTGRGFGVKVAVPFGKTLDKGLTTAAARCVESCPTGALAMRRGKD